MREFRMPSLGADMEDAVVVEWLVAPGSTVARGDIVAVVETDKGAIEIEIFEAGVIDQIIAPVGQLAPVDTVLATLREPQDSAAPASAAVLPVAAPAQTVPSAAAESAPAAQPPSMPPTALPAASEPGPSAQILSAPAARLRISPYARRLAEERNIDPATLTGSGPQGAIGAADVAQSPPAPRPATKATAGPSIRSSIGNAMARSKREIPHYYLSTTIDMTAALTWMEARNAELPVAERMLHSVLLLRAVALGLERFPELNGRFEDGEYWSSDVVNLGMAIALRQGGLVAPAIQGANKLALPELMRAFRDLVARARSQKLRASELSSPTMTLTNLGEQGVEVVYPVIYPPQVAIVGFGSIRERPWVVDGEIAVARLVVASLAADHRASDGRRGGLFLGTLNELLQHPELL
jgi:pyruvate dehydrogenase E2 component (dihydrolipoamide acetyltransferase)